MQAGSSGLGGLLLPFPLSSLLGPVTHEALKAWLRRGSLGAVLCILTWAVRGPTLLNNSSGVGAPRLLIWLTHCRSGDTRLRILV